MFLLLDKQTIMDEYSYIIIKYINILKKEVN